MLCQPKGVLQLFCNYSFSKASFFTLEDIKRPRHNAARSRLRIRRPKRSRCDRCTLGGYQFVKAGGGGGLKSRCYMAVGVKGHLNTGMA